jgi:tRNA-(ms[2]io[6]A)-hydroxylase
LNTLSPESFLNVSTPESWIKAAVNEEDLLLVDHAHCERKAASSALSLIYRHLGKTDICARLSRIVREEMRHFEQVLKLIESRGHKFRPLSPSRYAKSLHAFARGLPGESDSDLFIVAAIIEARSCERFRCLLEVVEPQVVDLYARLCDSEERHFLNYLEMAEAVSDQQSISTRTSRLVELESRLVTEEDAQFRFHSGSPSIAKHSSVNSSRNHPRQPHLSHEPKT